MGLLNSNQILPGARRPSGDKTYALMGVTLRPTAATAGSVLSFTGGSMELEAKNYSFNGLSLDFANLGTLVAPGQTYLVAAVPAYSEPTSQSAAETAGLNYFVDQTSGEGIAKTFLPAAVQAAVTAAGGLTALTQRVYMGSASASDISTYNTYSDAAQRLIDPRYAVFPLAPVGMQLVLAQVAPQDNSAQGNALLLKNQADFTLLQSQLPMLYTQRLIMTAAQAATRYANVPFLVASANSYASVADAQSDLSATVIPAPFNFGAIVPTTTVVAVTEYTYPSNMPLGQTGNKPRIIQFLAREQSAYLGRINPIYLHNERVAARFEAMPASRITLYGDPCPLVQVALGGTVGALTLTTTDAYGMMIG